MPPNTEKESKSLLPYQARVVTEKADLDEKINKLKSFIDNQAKEKVDSAEYDRLVEQLVIMKLYDKVLTHRILCF